MDTRERERAKGNRRIFSTSTSFARQPPSSLSSKQDFRVFVARDATLLAQQIASGSPPAWCGWRRAAARAARGALRGGRSGGKASPSSFLTSRLLGPGPGSSSSSPSSALPPCEARLPTFGASAVAVIPRASSSSSSSSKGSSSSSAHCSISTTQRLDPALAARLLLGAALFLLARSLAASASFRVSAGAVSFALASLLVVLFLVARAVPNKKQLAVVAAAMGSGALTLARLLFGHWIPTFSELASAKVLAVFSACSLAVGAAVAFWFDDPGATKAHAILAAALRLVGLGLVAGGVSSPVVGVSLAGALALSVSVGPQVAATVAEWRGRIRERRRAQRQRRAEVVTMAEAVAATATMTATPSPPRRQQASPLLQQQQRSPEAALRQRRRSASVSTAAFESPERSTFPASSPQRTSRGGDGEEGEGGARSRSPTVGPLLFGRRPPAAAAAAAPTVSAPSSSRPPLLFRSAAAVPLPSAHNEEEEREREEEEEQSRRESEQQQRRRTTTSEHRPPPLQRQQSGWQREEPQQQSHRAAAATASAATPARSFQQRPQSQRSLSHAAAGSGSLLLRSPLVDRGLLLNEATGKTIKIGAATYNRLVLEGYTVDEGRGTLSPPVRARRTGRGRGQEGGEEEEEAGGGTSNLRPRTRNG